MRWPWLIGAALAAAFITAFPVRTQLAKAEFDRQAHRWAEAEITQSTERAQVHVLETMATPDDAATLSAAKQNLHREVTARIERIRTKILSERTPDPGMRALREALAKALVVDRPPTAAAAERRLAAQADRFHREPTAPAAPPVLTSGDAAQSALSHYLDEPTGATIVTVSRASALVIDLDRSTTKDEQIPEWAPFGGGPVTVVARTGYVGALVGGSAYALSVDTSRQPVRLGEAEWIEAGDRPDSLRLITLNPMDNTSRAREVDGAGRTVSAPGPWQSIDDGEPGSGGGQMLDHIGGVAALGRIEGGTAVVDLVRASSATVRVRTPDGLRPDDCKFSPDGARLACVFEPSQVRNLPFKLRLGLVDLASGAVTVPDGLAGTAPLGQIQWTSDSSRIFVSTGDIHPLATYRIGASRVSTLRYTGNDVQDFVVLSNAS